MNQLESDDSKARAVNSSADRARMRVVSAGGGRVCPSSLYPPYYTCRVCEPSQAPHTWVSGVNPAERPASAVLPEVGRYGTLHHGSGQGLKSVDVAQLRLVVKTKEVNKNLLVA